MDEKSLAKARRALNKLYEEAWVKLDKALGNCKSFQERFEQNDGQVTRDVNRLVERINDLSRVESESTLGIEQLRKDVKGLKATKRSETQAYLREKASDASDLTTFKNDLQVFAFIVTYTGEKCQKPDVASFAQVCTTKKGKKMLVFEDKHVQEGYQKLLTNTSKKSIEDILESLGADGNSFLQSSPPTTTIPLAYTVTPPPADQVMEVGPPKVSTYPTGQSDCGEDCATLGDCTPPPPCPIHDKLSLLWGKHKDDVDELTMEMMRKAWEFEEMKRNIESQIRQVTASESKLIALLSETKGNLAADRSEIQTKYALKRRLTEQYTRRTTEMKKNICWIAGQDMCAVKVVRNAIMDKSTECPAADIVDCVVDDWVPEICSKSCDDDCKFANPWECGGWKVMTRTVVVDPDTAPKGMTTCGIKCPALTQQRRCGQVKCPIDCEMSAWSGYSSCSAECGGGVKKQTRTVATDAFNGGSQCPVAEDIQNCNDLSCDRDCKLQKWTKWTGCSVACGGGVSIRRKHVLIPTRGNGKCPGPDKLGDRLEEKKCNEHDCAGDEICIAKQDLVLAVDSSSSIALHQDTTDAGFVILKQFTKRLISKYEPKMYGAATMQIGLIGFGNGAILSKSGAGPNGIAPAILVHKLSRDLDAVSKAVCSDTRTCKDGMVYKKGFTNMAQAFALAERMFSLKPVRGGVQHALMVISDGQPSFKYQTDEMAQQLSDKSIMKYFVAVTENGINSDMMNSVKKWASQPWKTNVLHIKGGLNELAADTNFWAQQAIVKFCPKAYSPSANVYEEKSYGYKHVMDGAHCGNINMSRSMGIEAATVQDCAGRAQEHHYQTFLFGTHFQRGKCIGGTLDGDLTKAWQGWTDNKMDPKCPPSVVDQLSVAAYDPASLVDATSQMGFDFYMLQPPGVRSTEY